MKKILAIILTVAMATAMLCSTAMAASIAPLYWDLDIELRKADPDNVIKDGIIGEKEYEKLDIDNDLLWINWNTSIEGGYDKIRVEAEKLRNTLEYYFSWDEVHGFNFAVKYKPLGKTNEFTTDFDGEPFLATPGGGLCLQVYYTDDPRFNPNDPEKNGTILYYALGMNSNDAALIEQTYGGQKGFKGDYAIKGKGEDVYVGYDDATGIMTYEWSIPLDAVAQDTKVGGKFYFVIGACTGEGKASQGWDAYSKNYFSLNLGQWGFGMGQDVCVGGKATTATISDIPVGYVEPEPTPEPTPTPTPAPTPAPTEKPADNGWMLYVIIIEAVAIVALVAVVVLKKKK